MKRRTLVFVGALVLASGFTAAEDKPASAPPPAASAVQDLVFLGEARPVHLRLQIDSMGKPFPQVWDEFLHALFQYLDRNGDGVLSREEAERAPRAQNLKAALSGNFMGSGAATATMTQLDTDPRDGKVTFDELAAYYRRFALTALQVNFTRVYSSGDNPLTEALFRHLDTNGDGKLSREEVLAAPQSLRKLDLDDDEMIATYELVPSLGAPTGPVMRMGGTENSWAHLPKDAPFILIDPTDTPRRLADQLLARYDRNKDQHLSREEIGLDQAAFDQLDVNHDGKLDVAELGKFLTRTPDVTLHVQLGPPGKKEATVELEASKDTVQPLAKSVHRGDDGSLVVVLGDSLLEFRSLPRGANGFADARRSLQEQFKAVRGTKDGIDKGDADRSGVFGPLFRFIDRDGDGKVTEKELTGYLELLARGTDGSTVLNLADHGRMLFDLLDTNRDGKLGPRELRQAWTRLAPWDRNGDGALGRDEVPRRFQFTFSQGQPPNSGISPEAALISLVRQVKLGPAKPAGPLWFRKMDRNGDGDVSPREWLGSPADFKRIDTDGDGLIDVDEAIRFDAETRKRKP